MAQMKHAFSSQGRPVYVGLSTDTKPITSVLAIAIESDTGIAYINATGTSGWQYAGDITNVLSGNVAPNARSGLMFGFGSIVAAAAGIYSSTSLHNNGTGVLEVTRVGFSGYGADVKLGFNGSGAGFISGTNKNGAQSGNSIGKIGQRTAAASAGAQTLVLSSTDAGGFPSAMNFEQSPLILNAGDSLNVEPVSQNTKLFGSFEWREVLG